MNKKDDNKKPARRGRLSKLLNGENIKNESRSSKLEEPICDRHIDGA